ncbi:MAG: hypothetical protein H6729_00075 [Deltaproteobacteria bacterium]|nr:hypothetical protein [Deltaproteobacteria bacterium]
MTDLSADIASSIRDVLIQAILNNPKATIADLLDLARGENAPMLRGITLGELADAMGGAKPGKAGKRPKGKPAGKTPAKVNTRTAPGRAAFEEAILGALGELGGGPVSGADVKAKVGGTSLQVRTAMNRLIEAGKVTFEGKARGTKYSLAK